MKIKLIQRDPTEHTRTKPTDLQRVVHNADPKLHPFEKPREYVRALNAVKTQRMFAKPFIRALDGHRDSVYVIAKHPHKIALLVSGSADGEVRLWDVSSGDCLYQIENAHRGFVRGLGVNSRGQILTAGDDCGIKLWDVKSPTWIPQSDGLGYGDSDDEGESDEALDIMRDVEEAEDSEDSQNDAFADLKVKKKQKKSSKKSEQDEAIQSRRYGAPIFQSQSVLGNEGRPIATWLGKSPFSSLSHKWSAKNPESGTLMSAGVFATSSNDFVQVWDYQRSEPTANLTWNETSPDSFLTCVWNPVEHDILASTASDRSMAFFDMRSKTPVRKLTMSMNCNAFSWNPMEAFNFTVANEDHNLYTFDMRNLAIALNVHTDHAGAVLDVDYSPTGREFVSGSYDKTIRIFEADSSRSREVYHTKRMQRVFCVKYSLDASYVMSASDDTNIRVWKARADTLTGVATPRQRQKIYYQNQLVQRYKHLPEIAKIDKKRNVPKDILVIQRTKRIMRGSAKRKLENLKAHASEGSVSYRPERKKHIVRED